MGKLDYARPILSGGTMISFFTVHRDSEASGWLKLFTTRDLPGVTHSTEGLWPGGKQSLRVESREFKKK